MVRRSAWTRSLWAGLLGAAAVAGGIGILAARTEAKSDPRVYRLDNAKRKILGFTPGEWTVQWWQWTTSIPLSVNPLVDTTGALVEVGQHGPVWFLAGSFIGGTIERTAVVPTGQAFLIPLVNFAMDNFGVDPPMTEDELRDMVANSAGGVDPAGLFLSLDGVPVDGVERGRVADGPFTTSLPEENIWAFWGASADRGIYGPTYCDGFWVMLKPLSPGAHTLQFGDGGGQNITYYLTVVESNRP